MTEQTHTFTDAQLAARDDAVTRRALQMAADWHSEQEILCRTEEQAILKAKGHRTPMSEDLHNTMVSHMGSRNAILALQPAPTRWQDVPEGFIVVPVEPTRELARIQPCGCIVCECMDDERCHGCGAKNCGTHPVGKIPNPIYRAMIDKA